MKFLSIGECMLELAPDGPHHFKASFAGDTFNTVWYVAQLSDTSVQPMYLTAVGDDTPSRDMIRFMEDAGIKTLAQERPGKSVGLYMISLKNGERSFSYWRDSSAARTLARDLDKLPVAGGDIAYFSGITLAILPPEDRQKLLEALLVSQSHGARVVFDPNLRPRLWQSSKDMLEWTMKGAAIADMCLPSFEDEAVHFGDKDPIETCERYASNGSSVVVVKNGPDPITLYDSSGHRTVALSTVPVVTDTTAAGDSFNAGLILSQIEGHSLDQAALEASRLSAKVISQSGALVDVKEMPAE